MPADAPQEQFGTASAGVRNISKKMYEKALCFGRQQRGVCETGLVRGVHLLYRTDAGLIQRVGIARSCAPSSMPSSAGGAGIEDEQLSSRRLLINLPSLKSKLVVSLSVDRPLPTREQELISTECADVVLEICRLSMDLN